MRNGIVYMTSCRKKIVKTLLLFALIMSSVSSSFANELDNSVNENNSLYRYYALENKVNFTNTIKNTENLTEKTSKNSAVISENDDIEKLQNITRRQTDSMEKSEKAIKQIENRSGVKTFFIGNGLGTLKFQLVQMRDMISSLKTLSLKDNTNKTEIDNQMESLEKEKQKVEDFIWEQEKKFVLFGWLVNII